MKRKIKILLLPLIIVFVYLSIFFGVFIFKKGNLIQQEKNIDNTKNTDFSEGLSENEANYGYAQNSAIQKNSKYSSLFSPKIGNENSKVNVVVFYDFDCIYSWEEYKILYNVIKKNYNNGYFEFRNFPLESVHPNSRALANASMCANEQKKFLEMFNEIFSNFEDRENGSVDINTAIKEYAKNIELDTMQFNKCMSDLKYDKIINKDIVDAINFGVEGTPTFFVNSQKYPGVITQEAWDGVFKIVK